MKQSEEKPEVRVDKTTAVRHRKLSLFLLNIGVLYLSKSRFVKHYLNWQMSTEY